MKIILIIDSCPQILVSMESSDIYFITHFGFFNVRYFSIFLKVKPYSKLKTVSSIHNKNIATLCLFKIQVLHCNVTSIVFSFNEMYQRFIGTPSFQSMPSESFLSA